MACKIFFFSKSFTDVFCVSKSTFSASGIRALNSFFQKIVYFWNQSNVFMGVGRVLNDNLSCICFYWKAFFIIIFVVNNDAHLFVTYWKTSWKTGIEKNCRYQLLCSIKSHLPITRKRKYLSATFIRSVASLKLYFYILPPLWQTYSIVF